MALRGCWLTVVAADRTVGGFTPSASFLEYDSLRECLCEATRTTGVSPLACHPTNTLRRCLSFTPPNGGGVSYDGGPWKWGPILASLQVEKDDLPPNERSGAVLEGFAFWGLRPASEGKRYFGAVVAHGGLPLKLIGHGAAASARHGNSAPSGCALWLG